MKPAKAHFGAGIFFALVAAILWLSGYREQSKSVESEQAQGECRYEGAECPNVQRYLRDYQVEYHFDTVWIYDADRLVGSYIDSSYTSKMDSIILKDNL